MVIFFCNYNYNLDYFSRFASIYYPYMIQLFSIRSQDKKSGNFSDWLKNKNYEKLRSGWLQIGFYVNSYVKKRKLFTRKRLIIILKIGLGKVPSGRSK